MEQKQIWIVDDEAELAGVYSDFLGDSFKTRVFRSAEAALELFDKEHASPDLVLSDIRMPGMDGLSFIEELRTKGMEKPVVMMSGYAEKKDLLRASNLEISGFLEKPCDLNELKHRVESAIYTEESSPTEQLIALLSQKSLLLEKIISKCVERYASAENLLDHSNEARFSEKKSTKAFLEMICTENKMHRILHALQEKIEALIKLRGSKPPEA